MLEASDLVPQTPRTIRGREAITRELRKVRTRGFATNNEEVHIGVRSVAAPIRAANGEVVAAVNIAVPTSRVSLRTLETVLAKTVVETGNRISFALGYTPEVNHMALSEAARVKEVKFSAIRAIVTLVENLKKEGKKIVDLSLGRPDFDTPLISKRRPRGRWMRGRCTMPTTTGSSN